MESAVPPQSNSPRIEVIGLYSFIANQSDYSRFIQEQVAFRDPANLDEREKALFGGLGRGDSLRPFTDEDRLKVEKEYHDLMAEAVVVEALVSHADASFNVDAFVQQDPSQPEGRWQVAWNEKFLTVDGETLHDKQTLGEAPDEEQFRVVFVIHFWRPHLPLHSSYGELALPPIQPLPERLWRLAPYELPY